MAMNIVSNHEYPLGNNMLAMCNGLLSVYRTFQYTNTLWFQSGLVVVLRLYCMLLGFVGLQVFIWYTRHS